MDLGEDGFRQLVDQSDLGCREYSSWKAKDADLSYWWPWCNKNYLARGESILMENYNSGIFRSNQKLISAEKNSELEKHVNAVCSKFRYTLPSSIAYQDQRNLWRRLLREVHGKIEYIKAHRYNINSKLPRGMQAELRRGYQFPRIWQELFAKEYGYSKNLIVKALNLLIYESGIFDLLVFSDGTVYKYGHTQACRRVELNMAWIEKHRYRYCVVSTEKDRAWQEALETLNSMFDDEESLKAIEFLSSS
jgi:hypothetical protein